MLEKNIEKSNTHKNYNKYTNIKVFFFDKEI